MPAPAALATQKIMARATMTRVREATLSEPEAQAVGFMLGSPPKFGLERASRPAFVSIRMITNCYYCESISPVREAVKKWLVRAECAGGRTPGILAATGSRLLRYALVCYKQSICANG